MKNLIKIILVLVTFLATSCSKDYLEKKPLDAIPEENVFNDATLLSHYVTQNYNSVRDLRLFLPRCSVTDDALRANGSLNCNTYLTGQMTPDNVDLLTADIWKYEYEFLRKINLFFEKVETSDIEPTLLDIMKGEMHFIRAWIYFDLLRVFGGVPIIIKTFSLTEESFELPRNTYEEVVEFIIQELDMAISTLPSRTGMDNGRANLESALALKGRTLMYAASPLFNPDNKYAP